MEEIKNLLKDCECYGHRCPHEISGEHYVMIPEDIDSLINLAVSKEREGIKNILWQVREDWRNDGQIQVLDTADYLINLINTK